MRFKKKILPILAMAMILVVMLSSVSCAKSGGKENNGADLIASRTLSTL